MLTDLMDGVAAVLLVDEGVEEADVGVSLPLAFIPPPVWGHNWVTVTTSTIQSWNLHLSESGCYNLHLSESRCVTTSTFLIMNV